MHNVSVKPTFLCYILRQEKQKLHYFVNWQSNVEVRTNPKIKKLTDLVMLELVLGLTGL